MFNSHRNVITAALLFTANKYRQIQLRSRMFADSVITEAAAASEANARRLITTVFHAESLPDADKALLKTALTAFVDNLNRTAQLALAHGDLQNSALGEHRCREVYAALDAVGGFPVTAVEPLPVQDHEDQ